MDNAFRDLITSAADHGFSAADDAAAGEEEDDNEFCNVVTWEALSKIFREVQSVLDHNRRLIQQVNENHRSKIPHNLAKNVHLICEIDANMSKVVGLYSDLSANLFRIVQKRRAVADNAGKKVESWNSSVIQFSATLPCK